MKREKPQDYEARTFTGDVEIRQREDGGSTLVGLGAVFDSLSENLGGFREIIKPGAFDDTDMNDVRGLFNHDSNFVLGRNVSSTLRLERTDKGLRYEIDSPNTQTVNDLVVEPIKRGDISQSSFGFIVGMGNDEWAENDDGVLIRTIHRIRKLFDVSPVTFPAYTETTVGARSLERYLDQRQQHDEVLAAHAKRMLDFSAREREGVLSRIA